MPDKAVIQNLQEQVRLLTFENQHLSQLSEDIFLLGAITEKITTATAPDLLVNTALEKIALLKTVPLCLFCLDNGTQGVVTHYYATVPGFAGSRIPLAVPNPNLFSAHNHVCTEEELEKIKAVLLTLFPAMDFAINSTLCIARPRVNGENAILVLADNRSPHELRDLEPLLGRIADIIIARLDSLLLQDSLKAMNRDLEQKVSERTNELLRLNEALTGEIADRNKAEQALRSSEYRYRTLVDSLPLGVAVIDRDNRIIMVNRTHAEWFGRPVDYFPGKFCYEQFEGRGRSCPHCPGAISLATEGEAVVESVGNRQDGSQFPVRLRTVPLYNGDDHPSGFIEVVEDISELKREEQENAKLNKKMLHVQKLESLGVLAGGIAHDFNNILMVILGHAELAKLLLPPTTPIRDNLQQIEQAAQKAADLSRQMLAYSGRGKFVIETLDLGDLITDMVHMLQVSIFKKVVLRCNLTDNLPPVEVDATQIRQVLMNLVINASEAIGDRSGIIAVSTGAMLVDRSYLSDTWFDEGLKEGLYVFVEVADTGCGMDTETMKRVFDPFFTTKFTGRGLGMAAVLGIVRGHQGSIKIYSEPGKGSTFKVILPTSADHAGKMRQSAAQKTLIQGNGTILLVDDEETIRALGQDMLEMLGYQVITAADGRQALEKYLAHRDSIVVVLLDLTMPHMDGEETFRELRRIRPDIRVVMSSGYNEQEVSQRFMGKGLAGFIQKPYKLSELSTVLTEALRQPDAA